MKNQIISGVVWSMNLFNYSFHEFSRILLRRSSEHSVWLKFKRKIQEYFRKSLHWSASERWWTWKSSPSWQSENSIDDDDGCAENEINENNEMRKWKWREVWICKKKVKVKSCLGDSRLPPRRWPPIWGWWSWCHDDFHHDIFIDLATHAIMETSYHWLC